MKKLIASFILAFVCVSAVKAQFGFVKKEDIEKFKDTRLIVVLYNDSIYNASIRTAVEKFWTFNGGFEFVNDSMMKAYAKGNYSYLSFAKGKKSNKIKTKLGSSEDDCNGLVVTSKYRKRAKLTEIIAEGYCSNVIDTTDWYPEMVRGVQMLNNYFNYAVQAENDKDIDYGQMLSSYPGDLTIISSKKLLIELGTLQLKGKEDATAIYGNDVEEVDRDEINKAILTQDPDLVYVFTVFNEKESYKLFVSASNSDVMHVTTGKPDQLKTIAKDLKALKQRIDKANK
ncbi:MAG: hypothetical protein V4590_03435 [Bacteroidota bacterium]